MCFIPDSLAYDAFLPEVESRSRGSRPRTQRNPRPRPKTAPFRGQTLSRPRTGMLDAKAKDQGHRRKCSPKKRSSKEFFRPSPKKRSSNKFFRRSPKEENKIGLCKFSARFLAASNKILTVHKVVLFSAEYRAIFEDLRLRRQG